MRNSQHLAKLSNFMDFWAIACATRPDTPVSTLIKTMEVLPSFRAKADLIANINRDSSPPDATLTRGLKSSPGFVEI